MLYIRSLREFALVMVMAMQRHKEIITSICIWNNLIGPSIHASPQSTFTARSEIVQYCPSVKDQCRADSAASSLSFSSSGGHDYGQISTALSAQLVHLPNIVRYGHIDTPHFSRPCHSLPHLTLLLTFASPCR